jgi:predicted phage terminase large subunit-like protein
MVDALSEAYNDTAHTWKESDHDSRKERNCPEIYIGTRWTKNDVIGKALESGKIDREEKIPAMVLNEETGEYESFCDNVKTTAEYLAMKADIEESIWQAEWQQEPIESKGLTFPKSKLHFFDRQYVDFSQADCKFLYVDPANKGGDDLAAPHCYLIEDRIYVKSTIYNKDGTDLNGPRIVSQLIDTRTEFCNIEGNFGWAEFARDIRTQVQDKHDDCQIRILNNTVNKDTRILAMSAFVINHFYFDQDYEKDPEYRAFMRNLTAHLKEGGNKHDDAPDAVAGCGKFFKQMFPHLW